MRTIALSGGRSRRIHLDCGLVEIVKAETSIDFCNPTEALRTLATSEYTRARVLYLLAGEPGSDELSFLASLSPDDVEAAYPAIRDELDEFFPASPDDDDDEAKDKSKDSKPVDIGDLILQFAAIVGVDPARFTLRQLATMSRHRLHSEYQRQGTLAALYANSKRAKNGRTWTPNDFNPLRKRRKLTAKERATESDFGFAALKAVFCPGSGPYIPTPQPA